jgi:hypothetical protein
MVSSRNHYTNSAGIIATKFEETINGVKKTSKDTLGARFVSGITPDVLALGDGGIAERATSVSRAYRYETFALVKAGEAYRLTLRKSNTGYHAILRTDSGDGIITKFVLYGPKLRQLDPDVRPSRSPAATRPSATSPWCPSVRDPPAQRTCRAGAPGGESFPRRS